MSRDDLCRKQRRAIFQRQHGDLPKYLACVLDSASPAIDAPDTYHSGATFQSREQLECLLSMGTRVVGLRPLKIYLAS